MGAALQIRDDLSPDQLRGLARREPNGRAAARMYAMAHALEGMSRAEAAVETMSPSSCRRSLPA